MRLIFSNSSSYNVPHQYMIGVHKTKYLKMDAKFVEDDLVIDAPIAQNCDFCGKAYDEQPTTAKFLCEDQDFNRQIGRPGRVCIICYYRRYKDAGHVIPPPLRKYF